MGEFCWRNMLYATPSNACSRHAVLLNYATYCAVNMMAALLNVGFSISIPNPSLLLATKSRELGYFG